MTLVTNTVGRAQIIVVMSPSRCIEKNHNCALSLMSAEINLHLQGTIL